MKKKFLAVALALTFVLSMTIVAYATTSSKTGSAGGANFTGSASLQTYSASANIVTTASAASVSLSGKVYKLNTSTDTLSTSTLGNGGTTTASINLGSSAPTRFYKLEVKYTGSKGTGKWTDSTTIVT